MSQLVLEQLVEEVCPNCRETHEGEWKSLFDEERHYLTTNCTKCDYEIMLRKDEFGAGFDF